MFYEVLSKWYYLGSFHYCKEERNSEVYLSLFMTFSHENNNNNNNLHCLYFVSWDLVARNTIKYMLH